jgi:probable blue pigment (indigoidine) exporter
VTFLGLLSPVMATTLGWLVLDQHLSVWQAIGGLIVLGALVTVQVRRKVRPTPAAEGPVLVAAGDR